MTTPVPHLLLPYQQAWQDDRSKVRIAEKSRRVGFSWNIASECALDAAEQDGCDAWYVGYNKDMAEEFIRDSAWWAKSFDLACSDVEDGKIFEDDNPDKAILTFTIRFASGFRITALSSRPNNLRGKKGHIILDEAAFHDDLEGLIKAAMAVLIWGGRARVDIISTHNGVDNHYNTTLEKVKAGKLPYSLHRVTVHDALEQGLYKRICMVNGKTWTAEKEAAELAESFAFYGDGADEELLCIPSKSGRTYIDRDVIEKQMRDVPVFRFEAPDGFVTWDEDRRKSHVDGWCETMAPALAALPKDRMHFFGEDFGRTADLTVITPGYLTQRLRRRTPFVVELRNTPYEQQRQVLFFIVDHLPNFFAGALDATGNGGYLAEVAMQRYGERRITLVKLTEQWYAEHMPPFRAGLQDGLYEIARDVDHLSDLRAIKVISGIPKLPKAKTNTKTKKKGDKPRHGDAAIAYVLGWFAAKRPAIAHSGYAAPKKEQNAAGFGRIKKRGGLL